MNFRNVTISLALMALGTLSASAATNIALNKPTDASSGTSALAVDGNTDGTRWESSSYDHQWFYVDLEASHDIDHVKIMWERAFTKHFKIYVADELTQSMINNLKDNVYGDDSQASTLTNDFTDAGWTMVADVTQESHLQSQTVEVTSGTKGRYVAIECIERGTVWGNSFWEFSVYDSPEEVAKLSKITLSCDNTEGSTSQSFTINTSFKDQYDVNYTLTSEEQAAMQWIVSEGASIIGNVLTVENRGTYTVKAKIGDITSNELTFNIIAEGANLALNKTVVSATEGSENPQNAIDGLDTMWITPHDNESTNNEYETEIVIDLGVECNINCVHTWWEGASAADYTVTFSNDNITYGEALEAFKVTNGAGMINRNDWLLQEEAILARYVKLHATKAATQYGIKLRELEVYSNSATVLSSIKLTVDKECQPAGDFTFTATGYDQFGGIYDISTLLGTYNCSNATIINNVLSASEAGEYTVSYTIGDVTSNEVTVTVVDPKGENLATGKSVTACEGERTDDSKEDGAVDGVDNNTNLWGVVEPAGTVDHTYDAWLAVDLGKEYNLYVVALSWEGANSCRYTVETSLNGVDYIVAATYDKPAKQEFRKDYFAFDGDKARYVKINCTKASTGYGTKLMELYVYDIDGTTSDAALLTFSNDNAINIANGIISVSKPSTITVYSLNGTTVEEAASTRSLDIRHLAHGAYIVKMVDENGATIVKKVIK